MVGHVQSRFDWKSFGRTAIEADVSSTLMIGGFGDLGADSEFFKTPVMSFN